MAARRPGGSHRAAGHARADTPGMSCTPSILSSDLAFCYVDCDIPAGMTVAEWRRIRRAVEAPGRRRRGLRARKR